MIEGLETPSRQIYEHACAFSLSVLYVHRLRLNFHCVDGRRSVLHVAWAFSFMNDLVTCWDCHVLPYILDTCPI